MNLAPWKSRKKQVKKLTPEDVIRGQLATAYAIHPAALMPSAITTALSEAGFTIIATDELDREIALAHEAGFEEGSIL